MDSLENQKSHLCKCGCNIAITDAHKQFVNSKHYQTWRAKPENKPKTKPRNLQHITIVSKRPSISVFAEYTPLVSHKKGSRIGNVGIHHG